MVMKNKALVSALYGLVNNLYAINIHAHKKITNGEHAYINWKCCQNLLSTFFLTQRKGLGLVCMNW